MKSLSERKNSSKTTLNLWKCLQSMTGFESNRHSFLDQLFNCYSNVFQSKDQLIAIIDNSLDDKLIVQEFDDINGFRFVPQMDTNVFSDRTHDWYCFECDSCGRNEPLICCKTCFRAFHDMCLQSKSASNDSAIDCDDIECKYCLRRRREPMATNCVTAYELSDEDLNQLIVIFQTRLENSFKDIDIYSEYSMEKNSQNDVIIFKYIDLQTIQRKVFNDKSYKCFIDFEYDLQLFCHNFALINDESIIKPFVNNIEYELKDLSYCLDCYRYSRALAINSVPAHEWFTRVCNPPHRLVYAKYRKDPFWPSKVIDVLRQPNGKDDYLVQFFEHPNYSRGTVSEVNIRDIQQMKDLSKKSNKGLLFGIALLFKHLVNLRQTESDFKYEIIFIRLKNFLTKNLENNKYVFREIIDKLNIDLNTCEKIVPKIVPKVKPKRGELKPKAVKSQPKGKQKTETNVETNTNDMIEDINKASDESEDEEPTALERLLSCDSIPIGFKYEMSCLFIRKGIQDIENMVINQTNTAPQ